VWKLAVLELSSGQYSPLPPPLIGDEEYLFDAGWVSPSRVWMGVQNRAQTSVSVVVVDANTHAVIASRVVETSATFVNLGGGIHWLNESSFLATSEKTGFRQAYLFTFEEGGPPPQMTPPVRPLALFSTLQVVTRL
jgi:hypothetical protein